MTVIVLLASAIIHRVVMSVAAGLVILVQVLLTPVLVSTKLPLAPYIKLVCFMVKYI